MKIDISNADIINSKMVYIHDDTLSTLVFNRNHKEIILNLEDCNCNEYKIKFNNVIGFFMTSCDFWGESPRIFDFQLVDKDNNIIIPKMFELNNRYNYEGSSLDNDGDYIEIVITFVSGDELQVACKYILFEKNELDNNF